MNIQNAEDKRLLEKYSFIVKWGQELQSFMYYILDEVYRAEADKAPVNAIYKRDDGTWATTDDLQNQELRKKWNL